MPEPEQSTAESKLADWEYDLSPERANLKELVQLMTATMQTIASIEKPQQVIAGYADEILRKHADELPQSAVNELHQKRTELMQQASRQ
jgi:esterase/lipase